MGTWALALFSFLDSFIFPIPPLFLQVALSIERPRRSFWYAGINTAASVVGSIVGYGIGLLLFDSLGKWLVGFFGGEAAFQIAGGRLKESAFYWILIYSFVPLPYKLITIASGVFHESVPLATLLLASTVGRGCRFFLLGAICTALGARAKTFIERYFNWVCLGVGAVVVAILVVFKIILKQDP
jgi:membrane protein YqaA with SNARE-associated domain